MPLSGSSIAVPCKCSVFQSFFSVPNEGRFYLQSVDNEIVLWEPKTKEQSPGEVIQFNFPRIVFLL